MIKPLLKSYKLRCIFDGMFFQKSVSAIQMTNDDRVKEYLIPHYFILCCNLQLVMSGERILQNI